MDKRISRAADSYVEVHRDEIIDDLARLVRIPSVSVPGSPEPEPFGSGCARVLDEALDMARAAGMEARSFGNWYGLAELGSGRNTVGIFAHLDVVEPGSGWTFPPFELTERDGWLFGRGVADDKIAAVIGIHTARALKELKLDGGIHLVLYLGVCEEKGMTDIDRYLREHEQPEFSLVPDFMFPGSIGEQGVMKFTMRAVKGFREISAFTAGEPGQRLPMTAGAVYTGPNAEKLCALAADAAGITAEADGGEAAISAQGRGPSSRKAADGVSAAAVLARFLADSGALCREDESLMRSVAEMTGSARGECFGIDRDGGIFGNTAAVCTAISGSGGVPEMSWDIRYPMELTGAEIEERLALYAGQNGFELSGTDDTPPWLLREDDARIRILCDCWEDVSGQRQTSMRVGGGTYARKLKNAVSYGPKDPRSKCPFLPEGHGEIHSPDECRSVEAVLNAVRVYIRAVAMLASGSDQSGAAADA